jgi:hypothetical protein
LTQSVPGVNLQADIGSILIQDNQFCGAEVVYISDDDTGSVTEQGNDLVC